MDITKSHLIHHQKMAGVQNQSPNPTSLRTKTRTGSWIREAAQRPMTTLEELQKFILVNLLTGQLLVRHSINLTIMTEWH